MDSYFTSLLNIRRNRTPSTSALPRINTQDASVVRKAIQRIAQGDYAHLPNTADIKTLFTAPHHQHILRPAYHSLQLAGLSIDHHTARVLAVILLSRQCMCRHLKLYKCAFTDAGKKMLFDALATMADLPVSGHRGKKRQDDALQFLSLAPACHVATQALHAESPPADFEPKHRVAVCNTQDAPMGLYSLELVQVELDNRSCQTLGHILRAQPQLRHLRLSSNLIGPTAMRNLAACLSSASPQLLSLDLSDNRLQCAGAEHLAQYMLTHGRSIRSLDVSSNEIAAAGALSLAAVLRPERGGSLVHLNMDMNQLGAPGCAALADALAETHTLQSLKCSRNNIFDQGCRLLLAGLAHNPTLRHLDISGNFITDIGAQHIAQYLQSSSDHVPGKQNRLRSLDVSCNALFDEGMYAICQALRMNQSLVHLVADNTEISDFGALAASRLLEHTAKERTSLITLSLRFGRRITDLGYRALVAACQANSHVLALKVDLQFDAWRQVCSSLERSLLYNNMRAIDRYRAPLLMAARGRMLLCESPGATGILKLPWDIRRLIVDKIDRYAVLTARQRSRAVEIATSTSRCNCVTKADYLAYILEDDYAF
ncbi:hypothetical protein GGI05_005318, partial [Coemansia sp. RSA 2603]